MKEIKNANEQGTYNMTEIAERLIGAGFAIDDTYNEHDEYGVWTFTRNGYLLSIEEFNPIDDHGSMVLMSPADEFIMGDALIDDAIEAAITAVDKAARNEADARRERDHMDAELAYEHGAIGQDFYEGFRNLEDGVH